MALTITSRNNNIDIDGNVNDTSVTLNNGDVTIDGQEGAATVVVDNGNVRIDSGSGDVDVDVGAISIAAHPRDEQAVRARTNVGAVTLRVPADAAASLELDADVGIVDADLSAFTVTNLASRFRSMSATLNGGGGTIVGKNDVGNVRFGSLD